MIKSLSKTIKVLSLTVIALAAFISFFYPESVNADTVTLRPNGAGSECTIPSQSGCSACPNHWDCVDEASGDGTTYVYFPGSSSTWRRDLYSIPDVSLTGVINSVTHYRWVRCNNSNSQGSIRTHGNTYDTASACSGTPVASNPPFGGATFTHAWTTNPYTGSAWTWQEINDLEIGVRLTDGDAINGPDWADATQVYIVVNYTPLAVPTVTTQAATDISAISATGHGTIVDTGGENVLERGVEWGEVSGGPYLDSATQEGSFGTGVFTQEMNNLDPGKTYYYRAKARNSAGWGYGGEQNFATNQLPFYGVAVNFNSGEFSGYAWGSYVIGWLSFNCSNEGVCGTADYKVMTSFSPAPSIANFSNTFPAPCSQSRIPAFSWETDAELPYDYEIRLCGSSDCSGPGDPLVLELIESTNSTSWAPSCSYVCNISPYDSISFGGGTYYGQVRARNTGGQWSGWTTGSFATNDHAYPYPDFLCDEQDCEEMEIYEEVVVTMSNNSTTYDGPVSCSWDLPAVAEVVEGDPDLDCELQVKFSPPPPGQRNQDIDFTVTDSSSYSCPVTKTVEIRFPLPEYKEVPPMIWLKNFFARLATIFPANIFAEL
jgi:hypothetical protein